MVAAKSCFAIRLAVESWASGTDLTAALTSSAVTEVTCFANLIHRQVSVLKCPGGDFDEHTSPQIWPSALVVAA